MRRLLTLVILLALTLSIAAQTKLGGSAKVGGTVKVSVQVSGGLTDFVTDSFTEPGTGNIDMNTHVGELGATWTDHPHGNYPGPLVLDPDLDRVYGTGTSASYASAVPADADYEVCADFYNVTAIAVNIAVAGRMDTTEDTMYLLRLTDGTTWTLRRNVAAAGVNLGTSTNQIPAAGGAAKRACLVMAGDQISATVESITEIGPITDANITAAGRAGIRSTGASSATTGMHLDNFSARQ